VNVPLSALAATWPAGVRDEIGALSGTDAWVALPEQLVQERMKQGKVAFPWKDIRSWISPTPGLGISNYDHATLDLSLDVLMPCFLQNRQQTPKPQPRFAVDNSVPDMFSVAPPATESKPTPDNTTTAVAQATATEAGTAIEAAKPVSPGRPQTPAEVVAQAVALRGVSGALIMLPEGLLVAGKMSSDQDLDGLAAFLARAFGRLAQSAQDCHIGDPTGLNFIVNNVSWQIFRLKELLFAVAGVSGDPLPIAQLTALAGELNRE
jgi:predicted regulator of Ras-like GTPase activity (Roadblock/LC7/MglB family)